jgi:hypothetical protein
MEELLLELPLEMRGLLRRGFTIPMENGDDMSAYNRLIFIFVLMGVAVESILLLGFIITFFEIDLSPSKLKMVDSFFDNGWLFIAAITLLIFAARRLCRSEVRIMLPERVWAIVALCSLLGGVIFIFSLFVYNKIEYQLQTPSIKVADQWVPVTAVKLKQIQLQDIRHGLGFFLLAWLLLVIAPVASFGAKDQGRRNSLGGEVR